MADPQPAPLPPPPSPPPVPFWQNKYVGGTLSLVAIIVGALNEADVLGTTGKAHKILTLALIVLAALGYAPQGYKSRAP
jgi:hypothetical protein